MKRILVTLAAAAIVTAGASMALAVGTDGSGIIASPHDFTDGTIINGKGGTIIDESWNYRGEICRTCHAPHDKGRANYAAGLLWNRAATAQTFTMYNSETLQGIQDATPGGNTKLCLSCHDGTVGLDTFDSHAGATVTPTVSGGIGGLNNPSLVINQNLQGTHPVSITYDNVLDTGLNDPVAATWADGSTVKSTLQGGKVQCSTCHDVHNKKSVAGTHLLRKSNSLPASGLCLTCHLK